MWDPHVDPAHVRRRPVGDELKIGRPEIHVGGAAVLVHPRVEALVVVEFIALGHRPRRRLLSATGLEVFEDLGVQLQIAP